MSKFNIADFIYCFAMLMVPIIARYYMKLRVWWMVDAWIIYCAYAAICIIQVIVYTLMYFKHKL